MTTVLHTTVGGIASSLGGNASSGALGAGASEFAQTILGNIKDNSVKEWISVIIGSMAGKDGAFTALNGFKYNDELHPNYANDRAKLIDIIEEAGREEDVAWYWKLARSVRTDFANENDKNMWILGADKYLVENKGWNLSADLLKRSLGDSREAYYDSDSYASEIIQNSDNFKKFIGNIIPSDADSFSTYTEDGRFELDGTTGGSDLFAALHNYKAAITGTKNTDGTWTITATIGDVFDFSEFVTPNQPRFRKSLRDAFLWTANDFAYLDEKMGVIKPLKVLIDVKMTYSAQ